MLLYLCWFFQLHFVVYFLLENKRYMKHLTLSAAVRETSGRGSSNRLRASGMVPSVIYGPSGTTSLMINEKELQGLLLKKGHSAVLVEVQIKDKGKMLSDIADIQRDPLTDKVLHIDFHEVSQKEKMTTIVPIEFVGESIGVKNNGGILDMTRHEITIKCLPVDLPSSIKVDVTTLDVGSVVHFSDLALPNGVEVIGDPDTPVVSCKNVSDDKESESSEGDEASTSTD